MFPEYDNLVSNDFVWRSAWGAIALASGLMVLVQWWRTVRTSWHGGRPSQARYCVMSMVMIGYALILTFAQAMRLAKDTVL
jgi:hypothetical protein